MKKCIILLTTLLCLLLCVNVSGAEYTDVPTGSEYYEAVTGLSSMNVISGYEDGSFKPERSITRAEAATIIVRAEKLEQVYGKAEKSTFSDVPDSSWAAKYVMLANKAGIVNGYDANHFGPDDNVTYSQIIKMVVALRGMEDVAIEQGGWPNGYLVAAYWDGIIDENQYSEYYGERGNKPATRGDVAKFIYKAVGITDYDKLTVSGNEYYIGQLENELPVPDMILPGITDAKWYVFGTDDYKDFFVAGVKNKKVKYLAAAGTGFEYMGYKSGDLCPEVKLPDHVTLSADKNDGYKIHAVFIGKTVNKPEINGQDLQGESALIFHFTNAFRAYHKKAVFKPYAALDRSAELHSQDMADNNYFNHNSLDGRQSSDRIEAQGIRWSSCAENIAAGQTTGYRAYIDWINSEGHRKNIMKDRTYLGVGAGYNPDSEYKFYFTQNFCSLR